mgnify:CR=1|tara:strand:- start:4283 stop:4651 length:369 start_codon:yes stop_codon:yes gene_type:complete
MLASETGFHEMSIRAKQEQRFHDAGYRVFFESINKSKPFFWQRRIRDNNSDTKYWINVQYWDLSLEFLNAPKQPSYQVDVHLNRNDQLFIFQFSYYELFDISEMEKEVEKVYVALGCTQEDE